MSARYKKVMFFPLISRINVPVIKQDLSVFLVLLTVFFSILLFPGYCCNLRGRVATQCAFDFKLFILVCKVFLSSRQYPTDGLVWIRLVALVLNRALRSCLGFYLTKL